MNTVPSFIINRWHFMSFHAVVVAEDGTITYEEFTAMIGGWVKDRRVLSCSFYSFIIIISS